MIPAQDGQTRVMIYNVNTEARIEAIVQTPGRTVSYTGTRASTACRAPQRRSC
jgi:2-methylaconitate cis-trans-isomerase PrpF